MESPNTELIGRGRAAFADRDWAAAYAALREIADEARLDAEDLERLATAAYMLGRVPEMVDGLERAHHAYLEAGRELPAAKTAIWLGINLAITRKMGPAAGWIARGQRILESTDEDCVERGYLLFPRFFRHEAAGEFDQAIELAGRTAEIGRRFGDADLVGLAMHAEGRALVKVGRAEEGLVMLDEVMVSVTGGELSPVVTGIVYCSVIEGCFEVQEVRRARDWTAALSAWCDGQPDLVAFTGQCLAHRSEIMRLEGSWDDAYAEAEKAHERKARGLIAAQAHYQQAEVLRLRGDQAASDTAYTRVTESGGDPQPGLALLRLDQGDVEAAAAGIRRAEAEAASAIDRVRMLPAYVDIMLAAGDQAAADTGCAELDGIASQTRVDLHLAAAAYATGACQLATGAPADGLPSLRRALRIWNELDVPHEAARTRMLMAAGLDGLGDTDGAQAERRAATALFARLGAGALDGGPATRDRHGLTDRELEVLQLLTTGMTNRAIAVELVLSERTVDRHVSNIYVKLGVSSRAAATAYAYEHQLV